MSAGQSIDWVGVARELGPGFSSRAAAHDAEDSFVTENYVELKERRVFSAAIPTELGGGGASYPELCAMIQEIGHHCSSTALALSMHTHLLATNVALWKWKEAPLEPLLRAIAAQQIVMVSTGASDWLESSGQAEKVDGGYRVTGRKIFCSGSPAGDLLVTSAIFDDPKEGPTVIHFDVPMKEGVKVLDNWRTLGMRASGSNDVLLEGVFVPEQAVHMRRPVGKWTPFLNVIGTIVLPIVMSAYLGVAEAAAALARAAASKKPHDPNVPYLVGEMENALTTAKIAVQSMVAITNDYDFDRGVATVNEIFIRKTIASKAVIETAEKALQVAGGGAFFRKAGLERLLRDAHASQFHPMQEKRQHLFTGRLTLGHEP